MTNDLVERRDAHVSAVVPTRIKTALLRLAAENDRALSSEICRALRAHVERFAPVHTNQGDGHA